MTPLAEATVLNTVILWILIAIPFALFVGLIVWRIRNPMTVPQALRLDLAALRDKRKEWER